MFAMSQHHYYAAVPQPQPPRQYSGHGTSSAFSSSANPDEDWTKISDLAERRRIQNRIAQRNYRKKLKRRLEDLERRAGDGASSPEKQGQSTTNNNRPAKRANTAAKAQTAAAPAVAPHQQQHQQRRQQQAQQHAASPTPPPAPKPMTQSQFTPPMQPDDDYLFQATYDERERTHSPPLFAYSTYPPPDDLLLPPAYSAAQPYRAMVTTAEPYTDSLFAAATTVTAVPVTLPSMNHFSDAIKRETTYPTAVGDDSFSPYMNYVGGYLPGLELGAPSPYDPHSNPHTPPALSHSFDHSANCSGSGYEYPTTPLSMPASPQPAMISQQM